MTPRISGKPLAIALAVGSLLAPAVASAFAPHELHVGPHTAYSPVRPVVWQEPRPARSPVLSPFRAEPRAALSPTLRHAARPVRPPPRRSVARPFQSRPRLLLGRLVRRR